MSVYVLNIGNTHTQFGIFEKGTIRDFGFSPSSELDLHSLPDDMPCAAASVVPDITDQLPANLFRVSPSCVHSISLKVVDTSTIGADRLANAVALAETVELPAVCIDFGTAITFDIVDEDRVYHGGVISPGRQLLRKALNSYTAQLPIVPLFEKIGNVIGKNTVDAILSGTDRGILELVKGLISSIGLELQAERCKIVGTGGDRAFFVDHIPGICDGGIDFTLRGIGLIYEQGRK